MSASSYSKNAQLAKFIACYSTYYQLFLAPYSTDRFNNQHDMHVQDLRHAVRSLHSLDAKKVVPIDKTW